MILFINFILCSVQDIGDIELVSDLLTPQASGQRLACRQGSVFRAGSGQSGGDYDLQWGYCLHVGVTRYPMW